MLTFSKKNSSIFTKPFLISLSLLAFYFSNAQFSFKIKSGVVLSNFRNDYYTETVTYPEEHKKIKIGFQGGFASEYRLSKYNSIELDLLYTQKGTINSDVVPTSGPYQYRQDKSYRITWHYIELPLLLKTQLKKKLWLGTGFYFAYLINAHFKKTTSRYPEQVGNVTKYYSKFDLGISTEVSYQFKKIGIGVRYNLGLRKVEIIKSYNDPEFNFKPLLPFGKHRMFDFFVFYNLK